MINTSLLKELKLVLPNTNKALNEALKSASPKQLESLSSSSSKDLKSMMSDILKQSTNPNTSNKVLLELVKNNPTLKNLGSVSTTIKDLLNSIKSDKNPLPIEKVLQTLLNDIKDLKGSELKTKLINSNATVEDNKKDASSLDKIIKKVLIDIKELKQSPNAKEDSASIEKTIKNILLDIKELKTPVNTKEVQTILKDLIQKTPDKELVSVEKIIKNFLTDIKDLKGSELKEKLSDLGSFLESNLKNTNNSSSALKDIVSTDLKSLLSKVIEKESSPIEKVLKNFLIEIKDLKGSQLKEKFINSGVFLESNIKNAKDSPALLKEIVTNDLKSILHKASEEITKTSHPNQNEVLKNIDKLSLQIDNYQLISYLSNSSSLYLPFSWDQLEEGNIEIKKVKNDKFFCDIDLKLKDYGDVNLKLSLYEENQINLHIYSANDEFKSLIKENIPELRSALIGINVTPREIRIFQPKSKIKNTPYGIIDDNLQMGFEIKV